MGNDDATIQLDGEALGQLYQVQALYDMMNTITASCFDKCLPGPKAISAKLSGSDSTCLTLCTARYFDMKFLMAQRLVEKAGLLKGEDSS